MRALLAAALLSASCYSPSFISGHYKCDRKEECPSSFDCVSGRCVDPRVGGADLAASEGDGAAAPEDLSTVASDMSQPPQDLYTPDLTGDLQGGGPCTSLGSAAGREIVACRALFAGGNTSGICPSGYRICNADDGGPLAVAAGSATCQNLGGFYAAQISAVLKMNGDVQCEATTLPAGGTWALVGCGSELLTTSATTVGTKTVGNDCKKLKVLLPCDGTVKGWSCATGLSDATHTNVGRGGLLCCRNP